MPPRRPSEAELKRQLDEVHAARGDPTSAAAGVTLARALAAKSSFVVEAAARVVGEHELGEHAEALRVAYTRLAPGAAASDPGCKAKHALVEALTRVATSADDVYLAAVGTVQLEPVFGGQVDTAVALRCAAAAGLAQSAHPDAAVLAAELMADKEWDARAGGARALTLCTREAAEPALRLKLAAGDKEPAVLGEVLRALLALAPSSLPLVAARLRDDDDALAEQAALALGESRLDGAFAALVAYAEEEPKRERRRVALTAIALLRRDTAVAWLLERIADGDVTTAAGAVDALAIFRHDPRLVERVRAAAAERDERAVREALERMTIG